MANELTFRDRLIAITPPWLQGSIGGRLIYAFGLLLDYLAESVAQAVRRRFPNESNDALGIIGADRRMPRGLNETAATYAGRLPGWLDAHRTRGGPYALLGQVFAHYAASPIAVQLLYANGRRYAMGTDGVIVRSDSATPVTDLDAWARWWLAYEWPNALTSDGIWSDPGTYDDGGVWDSGMTPLEISDLRLIPNAWNAAHTQGFITLLQPGSSFIVSPWDLWGDPATWALPDALTIGVE